MAENLPNGWEATTRRIASQVAQKVFPGTQLARDLDGEAPTHIWERRNSFDPARPFEPWCYRVLFNLAMNLLRNRRRRRPIDGLTGASRSERPDATAEVEDRTWESTQRHVENQLDQAAGFGTEQLRWLETLPARRRVIALAVAGLWPAVPTDCWERWLGEAGIEPPFPPPECQPANGLHANVRLVAQCLGQTESAVRQHFYRSLQGLKSYGGDQP